ncbi:HVO_2072 family ArtA-dependent S-layer glycoprotein, partial [Halorubrum laminariae]
MTNDNNTRKKVNAVFFAAIMVVSMVAVGFAAAPAAALSDTDGDGVTASPDTANETSTHSFNVTYSSGDNAVDSGENITNFSVDYSNFNNAEGTTTGVGNGDVTVTLNGSDDVTVNSVTQEQSTQTDDRALIDIEPTDINASSTLEVEIDGITNPDNAGSTQDVVYESTTDSSGLTDPVSLSLALAAATGGGGTTSERTAGGEEAFDGSTVYQGEDDLIFTNQSEGDISVGELQKTAGNAEGTSLSLPIPEDASTGTYAVDGDSDNFGVIVQQPRITTSEVQLDGDDISQIATSRATADNGLSINASWNFEEAENITVTVEDSSGADITREVVDPDTSSTATEVDGDIILNGETGTVGSASVGLNLNDQDAEEYTVVFEGSDDLDYDSVVQEYTIETTNQDTVTVDTAEDTVTRGDNLQYTVSGATNNDYYTAVVQDSDLRDGYSVSDAQGVFRNVEDTSQVGVVSQNYSMGADNASDVNYAYAIIQIDGTTGVGSIETANLDDSSNTLDIYEAGSSTDANISGEDSVDDVDFDVEEGEVALDNPTDSYTVGSEVDVNGTAQSADDVAIYGRDNGDWELLNIDDDGDLDSDDYISVDSDDSFEEEDVRLSDASNIYSFEGSYDIGVVDAADLNEVSDASSLTTSQFSSASSARYTLQVEPGDLTANFGTINGQIADDVDDEIDVEGTAAGQDSVVIAFVGERGEVTATTASVDSDDTYDEEEISLRDISQGSVSGHVISANRDGEFGEDTASNANDLVNEIEDYGGNSRSGDQVRSRILSNTVDDTGSDDLIVSTTFRLNDATLSINDVYPEEAEASGVNPVAAGETLVVDGDTNRQSDNAAITLELLTEEDNNVAAADTDEWDNDGQWSASMDTSDLETGTYTLEADDGESTDRVEVEIVEERDTSDGDDGSDDGDDGSDGTDDGSDGTDDGSDGTDDGSDDGSDGSDGGD